MPSHHHNTPSCPAHDPKQNFVTPSCPLPDQSAWQVLTIGLIIVPLIGSVAVSAAAAPTSVPPAFPSIPAATAAVLSGSPAAVALLPPREVLVPTRGADPVAWEASSD